MARGTGTVVVKFLGDVSDLKKATGEAEGALGKVGSAVGGMAKTAALVGIPAVIGFGVEAVKAFSESEKVAAQTGAVLKSTGGAAKVTAGHVGDLAGQLSMLSGADDEAIQSGENMLLTFTNVQNRVGKGNDVFDQATATMLDMSTALGQDMNTSAIQLGKALNDPIKGVTALQKVGVTFTEGQKASIKAMQEHGDVAGAQKIILKELQTEFGGSAKAAGDTFAGQMNKLKVSAGNFMEDVGSKLVPMLAGLAGAFSEGGLGGAMSYAIDSFKKAWPAIQAALADILAGIGQWITGTAVPYLQVQFPVWVDALWKWIQDVTPPALRALGAFLADIGAWILNPGLPTLGQFLLDMTLKLWHWIQDATPLALGKMVDLLAELGSWILNQGLPKLIGFMANMGVKLIDWISDVFPKLPGKLGELIGKIAAWIVTDGVPLILKIDWKILEFITDAAKAAPGKLLDLVTAIGGWLKDKGPGLLADGAKLMAAAIEAPFKLVFNTIAGFWNSTLGKISFSIPDWVPGLGGKGFSFPNIPILDQGAIVSRPTLALLAANSRPEAVVPLDRAGGGAPTIVANFYGPQDPAGVARQLEELLYRYQQQGGVLRFQT